MKLSVRLLTREDGQPYPEFYDSQTGLVLEGVIHADVSFNVDDAVKGIVQFYVAHDAGQQPGIAPGSRPTCE